MHILLVKEILDTLVEENNNRPLMLKGSYCTNLL